MSGGGPGGAGGCQHSGTQGAGGCSSRPSGAAKDRPMRGDTDSSMSSASGADDSAADLGEELALELEDGIEMQVGSSNSSAAALSLMAPHEEAASVQLSGSAATAGSLAWLASRASPACAADGGDTACCEAHNAARARLPADAGCVKGADSEAFGVGVVGRDRLRGDVRLCVKRRLGDTDRTESAPSVFWLLSPNGRIAFIGDETRGDTAAGQPCCGAGTATLANLTAAEAVSP
mmetsp:Transcript_155349/g.289866  ORF Transcript_155349/g.289866 Transcript_155349/m.289866 type:complete len:234 (-) Transcript_155349:308-1009(-)